MAGLGVDERYQRQTPSAITTYVNPDYEVTNGSTSAPTSGVATTYYTFNGQHIAMRKNGVLTYLHADHLGSTLFATDSTGNVVGGNQPRYLAYGRERTPSLAALPTDYTFTGQKQDGSGLVYMNARYYDPQVGQFLSPDSIVPDATNLFAYHRYMYVNGNPLRYTDPSGHGDPTAGTLSPADAWQTVLDTLRLAVTGGATVAVVSEVGPPAAAAAATVGVTAGMYLGTQWAIQDDGPVMPPLYPTLGQDAGNGNISITIPVPGSTTVTSGVPLVPGPSTQSAGATAVNLPAQQLVDPLPGQQKGSNLVAANFKFPDTSQLAKRLGVSEKEFHRAIKKAITDDFKAKLTKAGIKNPDIGINEAGNIVFKDRTTGKVIQTDVPLDSYGAK